jgi:hypothetical protein
MTKKENIYLHDGEVAEPSRGPFEDSYLYKYLYCERTNTGKSFGRMKRNTARGENSDACSQKKTTIYDS